MLSIPVNEPSKTINVPFHGSDLYVVNYNGEPYVPMKPIVDGMGLAWQSQLEKIKQRFKSTVTEIVIVAADGKKREMICIALRKLAGWLATISPNKVKASIRDKVIRYQDECDDVLYEYWTTGEVKAKTKTTVQQRNPLKNAVNLLVSKKGIMYPEAYSLVHQRFNVEHIDELTADQLPQAIEYVHKMAMEGEYLGKEELPVLHGYSGFSGKLLMELENGEVVLFLSTDTKSPCSDHK
ncbi:phage antirepressor N-terminal domain-containing protein [Xenorhabdus bovienii]|uniref:phage antirepressor N-terminal domain-containing protein n=2 Tax=Xenorhabdus bovienii TaxID=40576 RepID=UPI0009E266F1|nr:phage antirepressor N-terminal domain-containing protein [Xenorhabdus bovienii]